MDTHELAQKIAHAALEKKAHDIQLLDLRGLVSYTDYFVICSANNERQTKAIHDEIRETLKEQTGIAPHRAEGLREGRWVLIDYVDVIVHIFMPETRTFYRLERLWADAPVEAFEPIAAEAEA